jgi:Bacterial extracellular solute-binding protein/von Willebrand factor type A domain
VTDDLNTGSAGPIIWPPEPDSVDRRFSGEQRRRYTRLLVRAAIVALLGTGVVALVGKADGCAGDPVTLKVSVAPEIEPAVTKAVARFNDARQQVDGKSGKCAKAEAKTTDPAQVITLLGQGVAIGTTSRPDVWIPDSSLWISLLRSMTPDGQAMEVTDTSVARSPIVLGMPQTFADELRKQGVTADRPSWNSLLRAGSGLANEAVDNVQPIPPNLVKLQAPDPARNAAGLASLSFAHQLWVNDPDQRTKFTGMVRTLRENMVPDMAAGFASFERDAQGRYPVIIAPEQAIFAYNQSSPATPALAVYPPEGTLAMDYPYAITTDDAEKSKVAKMLAAAMRTDETTEDVRALGFRSTDGKAPAAFGSQPGMGKQLVPAPQPDDVHRAIEVWYKLSKGIRNVTLVDVSSSTNKKVAADLTRLQTTVRSLEDMLALMPDDTELGIWLFDTFLQGGNDWQELVPVGPLDEQIGKSTRRQQVLSDLAELAPKSGPGPGLYDSVLAAFRTMTRSYKPEMVNSILVFTNGTNQDPDGTTLPDLLTALRTEYDPARPVQIIMIGYGEGVARDNLQQIAEATQGNVYVVQSPQEIQNVVLDAISRRACTPASC